MHFDLSPENCEYRGEGNAGLVISLKKEEKVLKLIKYDLNEDAKAPEQLQRQMEDEVFMVKNVMKPLLGKDLLNSPAIICLDAEQMKTLIKSINLQRPDKRLHRNVKEERTYGLVLPDYCTLPPSLKSFPSVGPVISIEIKPKPGFLLKESYLDCSLSERAILLCHFCRKQVYKMKKERVFPKSSYCPTDLFSGCPVRMLHALKMLLETPQNNIRIFKDQEIIYSDENKSNLEKLLSDFCSNSELQSVDIFCKLVIKILLKPFTCKNEKTIEPQQNFNFLRCANAHPHCKHEGRCHLLPTDCVLHRILQVQLLDHLDIQTVYSLFNVIKETGDENPNHIGCYSRAEIPPFLGVKEKTEKESDYEFASRKVWEFIIALVAKDCSIMLILKKYTGSDNCQNPNIVSDDWGELYLFSIAVLDLDTKPLNRIEKHYKRTPLWIQACMSLTV